ncbi:MAG: alpha-glucosidase C-terminal domain-containing protein [Spirochaetales bacterium]|nr:alpha-glucosidase C-terminal domain-containing protein [Spirochaetales bacterium]
MNFLHDLTFYHSYPLGMLGAPSINDYKKNTVNRLEDLDQWLEHIKNLGCTALYIGPIFESTAHGYDTKDFHVVDRRLGTNELFRKKVELAHDLGIKVVLDAVLNHTGRDFFAFQDIQLKKQDSCYTSWYKNINFCENNEYNDGFSYSGWNGCNDLPVLNPENEDVKRHLIEAAEYWIDEFNIDGLRLDAADCLSKDFIRRLNKAVKAKKPDFFMIGEIIHGDYREWIGDDLMESVTNYECYKGLFSSHNDLNYHEIAWSLNRQFGENGIYKGMPLYSFADNHDVARIATVLKNKSNLYPLHIILFTMPGMPSIYYGSEWGVTGEKVSGTDITLRPHLDIYTAQKTADQPGLSGTIQKLTWLRNSNEVLRRGTYRQILVENDFFIFERALGNERWLIAVNNSAKDKEIDLTKLFPEGDRFRDMLNDTDYNKHNGKALIKIHSQWGIIVKKQ